MFFSFWGLNLIKKKPGRRAIGNGFLARVLNWLMGGRNKAPLSRLNFGGMSPGLMTGMMRKQNVATWRSWWRRPRSSASRLSPARWP